MRADRGPAVALQLDSLDCRIVAAALKEAAERHDLSPIHVRELMDLRARFLEHALTHRVNA